MKITENDIILNVKILQNRKKLFINCSENLLINKIECVNIIIEKMLEVPINFFEDIQVNLRILDATETKILLLTRDFLKDVRKKKLKIKCKLSLKKCKYDGYLTNSFEKLSLFTAFDNIKQDVVGIFDKIPNIESNFKQICKPCLKRQNHGKFLIRKVYEKSGLSKILEFNFGIFNPSVEKLLDILPSFSLIPIHAIDSSKKLKINYLNQYLLHNNIFKVKIGEFPTDLEKFYQVNYNISSEFDQKIQFYKLFFRPKLSSLKFQYFTNLAEKVDHLFFQLKILFKNFFPDLQSKEIMKMSMILALEYLKIDKLFPLLIDPFLEEIFLDSAEDYIYLNHQKHGRCNTKIKINEIEIESLKTHLRFESQKRLDEKTPSLIHSINNKFFHCRFSIDIFPSHWKNYSLDIRKMNKNIYSLIELMELKTLNIKMASFLIFCIVNRINITIVGEVNSGKTTLLNSIDLMIPNNFRKIYVEETLESLEIPIEQNHQLKYIVEPDIDGKNKGKEKAIFKLLHRSGDIIILGEILNKSETDAMFHCLSAGLKGIQTTHASSIQGLINRWIIHFKIDKSCLNDLGIIVLMKKIGPCRKILSICETNYSRREDAISINDFFKYSPVSQKWDQITQIKESNLFKKLNNYINLSNYSYSKIINKIEDFLMDLKDKATEPNYSIFDSSQGILTSLNEFEPIIGGI